MWLMAHQDSTRAAMEAHALLKRKLRDVIASGNIELAAGVCEEDCEVSTLLYDRQCQILHQQIHAAAADVLALTRGGNRDAALEGLEAGNRFSMSLSALNRALAKGEASNAPTADSRDAESLRVPVAVHRGLRRR